jgi:ribosome-associated translation inhibitor RaiA
LENPSECGISLSDALHSRVRRLLDREKKMFEGRGPSVSIRLEVRSSFFPTDVSINVIFSGRVIAHGVAKSPHKIFEHLRVR